MIEKVKKSILRLAGAIQAGKIYSEEHPMFLELTEKTYTILKEILNEKKEIVIGILNEELAWENEIFFDISKKIKPLVLYLQEKEIERIYFHQAMKKEELIKFISILTASKEETQIDIQKALALHGIKNIKTGKIRTVFQDKEQIKKPENFMKRYDNSLESFPNVIDRILNMEEIDYLNLKFNILNLIENFMGNYQELLNLIPIKEKYLVTFAHLLNVSILSMYISSKFGLPQDDVMDIGIAALFHDIGKIYISKEIIKKKSKLAKDEFAQMKDHSVLGAHILLEQLDSLGALPAVVAFEHHLHFDLKGYPKVSFPMKPHIASLIVSMCDVYDALAQRRTYKKDYPPIRIYKLMMKGKGRQFDPELIEKFFKIMGIWPIGTVVSLTDTRIAVVREENEQDLFCPVVEVIFPLEKRELIDLEETKEYLKIKNALNPFGDGKKYLELI